MTEPTTDLSTPVPVFGRRSFLESLAALPFLAPLLSGRDAGSSATDPRSLIIVWLDGGLSHLDTFDAKLDAPLDTRVGLAAARTSVDGVFFTEPLVRLRETVGRCALIRTLTSGEGNHDRGTHYVLTGQRPSPVLRHPSIGSVLAQRTPGLAGLPAYVAVPDAPASAGPGFLAAANAPFEIGNDPSRRSPAVQHLAPRPGLRRILELLDAKDALDRPAASRAELRRDAIVAQARSLTLDPAARDVFDLARESDETRRRYGRHRLGQSCLLARRLVENDVRCVVVRDVGWDHHQRIHHALTYGFPPKVNALDESVSALVEDLDRRKLSERVVVLVASEFGRTPRVNPAGGRDHWPRAHSALLYGAGVARGVAIGRTDERGEEPRERPVSPADLAATILSLLGVRKNAVLESPDGRPIPIIASDAEVVREALA